MASIYHQVLEQLDSKEIEWLGFRELKEKTRQFYFRDGVREEFSHTENSGVMVEAIVNGQMGYAATSALNEDGIHEAVAKATQHAKRAAPWQLFSHKPSHRPPFQGSYHSPVERKLSTVPTSEISDLLIEICRRLKISDRIILTASMAWLVEWEVRYISTSGTDAYQEFSFITTDFEATAQKDQIIQRRTDGGHHAHCYQGGWEQFENTPFWDRVQRIAEQSIELTESDECPTTTTDLILMPDQMMLQIHETIGHPLELDRILGDERNYAGWSFVRQEDFGHLEYGSPLMNVTFDPTVPGEFASYAYDDTGATAQKEYLIREGRLQRGIGSLESQSRLQLPGVANARATSWNRPPIDRIGNINLEPGKSSFQDIIESVESGILMESNRSWSIDDYRNKFQFGCEYAEKIENGEIKGALRNPNYRGITNPFWKKLKKIGLPETSAMFGTPYCGKGEPNQIIRVGHSSPVCLFESVEVFGGVA